MIGIFGGTFDPVHYGHLRSALEVKELFGLDEVRLIPCYQPPHRDQPKASATMRLQMLQQAINHEPGLVVDSRELNRTGPSYMVDTLKSLREEFSEQTLLLFIGSDAFENLTSWHRWQQLFDYAHLVVLTRPGYAIKLLDSFFNPRLANAKTELSKTPAGSIFFQPVTQLDISATAIRNMIALKQSPRFLLPDAVIEYIQQHQLYQTQ
ncbi:MAG: nicotinate-nucleotide adenylyltransferase [Methylococcaceae bacterium]|nr:nicotinate-nucleotide adenylyltransferase [Methylococcaceae bacterium]MDZ4155199.1 nicotinate-nucleotide adenylyltransferase [Methylococcales bacterium]MDP2393529.1 nicotinate-nucleotide adenylyltransferase [Methylococcaceae bacterium]MDP3021400.1 nicotinate-nucleotide adenylyltransferase [Methylococcaceae bacterium]MDP3391010.1 nicotinate-nucleotide adenylyltransferase [Methylococcaceae bacterium]